MSSFPHIWSAAVAFNSEENHPNVLLPIINLNTLVYDLRRLNTVLGLLALTKVFPDFALDCFRDLYLNYQMDI